MTIGRAIVRALVIGAAVGTAVPSIAIAQHAFFYAPAGFRFDHPDGWAVYRQPASKGAIQWRLIDPTAAGVACAIVYIDAPPDDVWSADQVALLRHAKEFWEAFAADQRAMVTQQYPGVAAGDVTLRSFTGWPAAEINYTIKPHNQALGEPMLLKGIGTRVAAGHLTMTCRAPSRLAATYGPRFDAIIESITFSHTH